MYDITITLPRETWKAVVYALGAALSADHTKRLAARKAIDAADRKLTRLGGRAEEQLGELLTEALEALADSPIDWLTGTDLEHVESAAQAIDVELFHQ